MPVAKKLQTSVLSVPEAKRAAWLSRSCLSKTVPSGKGGASLLYKHTYKQTLQFTMQNSVLSGPTHNWGRGLSLKKNAINDI